MTVALLGGTFDPPHVGHVALARAALRELAVDAVVVVVVGEAAHKPVETDAETRLRLAQAAFAQIPRVEVSRHELDRPGPSYTVDTARWAAAEWGDVVLLLGADEFAAFRSWREPDEILDHARVAVASRPGHERERLDEVSRQLRRPERVLTFPFPETDVSSREIRARVAQGESIAGLVPPAVERLVRELRLYR